MSDPQSYGAYHQVEEADAPLSALTLTVRRLDLVTNWRRCGTTADFVGEFLSDLFRDQTTSQVTLSTIINELLENAVKYSLPGNHELKIRAPYFGERFLFETEHTCRLDQARELQACVERLGTQDPEELFLEQLEHTAQTDHEASGLGLISLAKDYAGQLGMRIVPTTVGNVVSVTVQVWVCIDAIEPTSASGATCR